MAPSGLVRLGELRLRQGRADEARALFERARTHPRALLGLGRLALRAGDARAACDFAERVLRRLPETLILERLPGLELLVSARAALGDLEEAHRAADELERSVGKLGTPYLLGRVDLVRAELAAASGEHEAARRRCEDAIDRLTVGAAPYEVALARVLLAQVLIALGRADAAAAEAEVARESFASLGATSAALAASALLAADGAAAPRALSELTPRELDVLALVAQGLGDAEIAERLVVSPHTVHRHVANIRNKLRLPSRSAAVAYAARHGLL
jgi:ATP/maltotriose-dependent transcriptional regulator MalT